MPSYTISSLICAIERGDTPTAKRLAEQLGPQVNTIGGDDGDLPLVVAIVAQNSVVCQALIDAGADPSKCDASGNTPISFAESMLLDEDNTFACLLLLRTGAIHVNYRDEAGRTLLMKAAHKSLKATQFLLGYGANPHCREQDGWTALHYAVAIDSTGALDEEVPRIVSLLLTNGSSPQSTNNIGQTCVDTLNQQRNNIPLKSEIARFLASRIES